AAGMVSGSADPTPTRPPDGNADINSRVGGRLQSTTPTLTAPFFTPDRRSPHSRREEAPTASRRPPANFGEEADGACTYPAPNHPPSGEETMLFSERSLWTMIHGVVLGGGGLLALAAALAAIYLLIPRPQDGGVAVDRSRSIAGLTGFSALMLWLATLVGTYVIFPPYRATPPDGAT